MFEPISDVTSYDARFDSAGLQRQIMLMQELVNSKKYLEASAVIAEIQSRMWRIANFVAMKHNKEADLIHAQHNEQRN